ncbi:FliA/WhiG family RNA polymerase sigma factor [Ewingella americana]|uniref:FliA/WhiG family RNA polymerase sigma factor n=1 Tax=Ewingella americana TaxID=41202 RepID=UPI0012AD3B19|nr:FliA/WhiG family RNA polymerase sigma factor [Ewingella americana]MRT04182.1 FliA/WhiG family RNA polymerase sigma factor [Ewingella americana]
MQADYSTAELPLSGFQNVPLLTPQQENLYLQNYLPLVKRVVRQLSPQCSAVLDKQDMEQIALMGLLDALRRYGQPDQGFGGYAVFRIRGSILDALREMDWRPRRLRQQVHQTHDDIKALEKTLGREPTFSDISSALHLTADEYQEYLQLESARTLASLDELLDNGQDELGSRSRQLEEEFVTQETLREAINKLEPREQTILALYYQKELSLKEISAVLNISEGRVCQINKVIVEKIKQHFYGDSCA